MTAKTKNYHSFHFAAMSVSVLHKVHKQEKALAASVTTNPFTTIMTATSIEETANTKKVNNTMESLDGIQTC